MKAEQTSILGACKELVLKEYSFQTGGAFVFLIAFFLYLGTRPSPVFFNPAQFFIIGYLLFLTGYDLVGQGSSLKKSTWLACSKAIDACFLFPVVQFYSMRFFQWRQSRPHSRAASNLVLYHAPPFLLMFALLGASVLRIFSNRERGIMNFESVNPPEPLFLFGKLAVLIGACVFAARWCRRRYQTLELH